MTWDKKARRRLSRERGAIFKDWGGRIPIALSYPNTYYVGMSNLGFQTIYGLLNSYDNIVCERVFWEEKAKQPLSIESGRPQGDFAVLAFSISYELDYFNVVTIIKSSAIPLFAADRNDSHPLLIAGGPCSIANPEPLSPFFDCFAIGEGEAILPPMLEALTEGVQGSRDELLRALASLPGVYVPSLHNRVSRQWVPNIDDFATTSVILTPQTELGGLYLIEVARGCRWGCRFCLAGFSFRPPRFRSISNLLSQAELGLKFENRIGLLGADVSDHPEIDELVARLRHMEAEISVSSLRIRPLSRVVLRGLAESGTQTVSLAPEAGSERLRQLINKGVAERDIIEAIDEVARHGLRQLKLYFMIGVPTESDDDIEEMIKLTLALKGRVDRAGSRLTLTVEPFVPKAGTPFQWLPMSDTETLSHRLAALKNSLEPKGIKVRSESVGWARVQGVLSRGDERLAQALARMEGKSLSSWRRALEEVSLDAEYYVDREIPINERLPWASIESGVELAYLKRELERARLGEETPPCPLAECQECGVC